jgi:hypothetical protein
MAHSSIVKIAKFADSLPQPKVTKNKQKKLDSLADDKKIKNKKAA